MIQGGVRTWRTPRFTKLNWATVTRSSRYSTATVVKGSLYRPRGQQVRVKQIHQPFHQSRPLQIGQLRTGTNRCFQTDGRADRQRARRKGTQREEGKSVRTSLESYWMHCQCGPYHSQKILHRKCRRFSQCALQVRRGDRIIIRPQA